MPAALPPPPDHSPFSCCCDPPPPPPAGQPRSADARMIAGMARMSLKAVFQRLCRPVDLHVDRVARVAREARIRVRREVQVRGKVRHVADVGRQEAVEPAGQSAREEGDEPGHDRDEERPDRPEDHPDQVRDREEQAEEDGQPRPLEVVGDHEANRVRGRLSPRRRLGLPARRLLHGLQYCALRRTATTVAASARLPPACPSL
jgi:hypothetical protein